MKKIILSFGLVMGLLTLAVQTANAADFVAPEKDQGNVTISSSETHKNLYTAGGNVLVNGATTGDLYVAGGTITVEGAVEQDLVATGGDVHINGGVGGDVRIAGGTVVLNSQVNGDVILMGGTIQLSDRASIAGDLVVMGGTITVSAPVKGKVLINGGHVTIDSALSGEVKVNGGELTFGSHSNIPGKITYRGNKEAVVQDGATISSIDFQKLEHHNTARRTANAIFTVGFVIKLLAAIAAALLLFKLFPRIGNELLGRMDRNHWSNLGIGFLGLIIAPIAGVILLLLFIGFYIALLAFFAYLFLLMIAGLIAAVYVGAWAIKLLTKKDVLVYDWQAIAIGVVILALVKLIPVVGWLAVFVILLMAFGASLRYLNDTIKSQQTS